MREGATWGKEITVAPDDARLDFHSMATTYETLRADIITAMKARDSVTTTSLRTADAAIKRAAMDARYPLKRVGTPSDAAAAARFLLSAESGWITGQVIGLDGGLSTVRA